VPPTEKGIRPTEEKSLVLLLFHEKSLLDHWGEQPAAARRAPRSLRKRAQKKKMPGPSKLESKKKNSHLRISSLPSKSGCLR